MRYDVTDFEWSLIEQLLPRNRRASNPNVIGRCSTGSSGQFPAIRRSDRRPPICVASITLPGSPVSLSSGDEVPHIFTRKSRLQPGEFLITSAKDFCNNICQEQTSP
jgi:hypothetical protein